MSKLLETDDVLDLQAAARRVESARAAMLAAEDPTTQEAHDQAVEYVDAMVEGAQLVEAKAMQMQFRRPS